MCKIPAEAKQRTKEKKERGKLTEHTPHEMRRETKKDENAPFLYFYFLYVVCLLLVFSFERRERKEKNKKLLYIVKP